MKRFFLILIVLVVLFSGGYYYYISKNDGEFGKLSLPVFLAKLNFLERTEVFKKSEEVNEVAQDIKVKTEDIFAGLSQSFSSTVSKVSSTVSQFNSEIKNNALVQAIFSSSGESRDSLSDDRGEIVVCMHSKLNETVRYSIRNPSEVAGASSSYSVDWGDGNAEGNIFTTGTVQVSHIYVNAGEFITKFKVESDEYSAEVSKIVCIK